MIFDVGARMKDSPKKTKSAAQAIGEFLEGELNVDCMDDDPEHREIVGRLVQHMEREGFEIVSDAELCRLKMNQCDNE